MTITRQDYMAEKVTHHEYYSSVASAAGVSFKNSPLLPQIKAALTNEDEHLNTIPLATWDEMTEPMRKYRPVYSPEAEELKKKITAGLKAHGDGYSKAGAVCVLKAAARNAATAEQRLEYLRAELRAERISYGELVELQELTPFIEKDDVELLQAAGAPEEEETTDTTITLDQFITQHSLTFSCHRVDRRPDKLMSDGEGMRHWRCRITRQGIPTCRKCKLPWLPGHECGNASGIEATDKTRSMGLYFSQGSAHTEAPTLADVLDCLASDASSYDNAGMNDSKAFERWAGELGYDTDSRSALRIFNTVKRQAEQLKRLLGPDAYEQLLYATERL